MKTIRYCSFMLVLTIATLSQCSKPDDEPGPSGPEEQITDEQRLAILDETKTKAIEFNNLSTADDRDAFLEWLSAQPHFSSAGYAEDDLFAVFKDDRVAFFVRTPLNDSTGRKSGGGRISSGGGRSIAGARAEDLPKTKKVSLFSGLGQYFSDSRLGIERAFSNVITQYQLSYLDASIENLKAVSGDAVFYINTHGGAGIIPLRRSNRTDAIMAWYTTDPCTAENERRYKTDIDTLNLVYMLATNDTRAPEWHYGITHYFIKNYMSFGENCLIYADACNTFSSINGAVEMRNEVIKKAANSKATYIGWTKVAYHDGAERAAHFIFERLLGNVRTEDPIQRPFDLAPLFEDLHERGWDVNDLGARLTYQTTNPDQILLTPTIDSLLIDEYTSTLFIAGLFGWDPGQVTIDGFPAEVISWNPYGVVCKLKESGLGSAGNVVVHSALGHQSNPVPITEWNIKLKYSANDNGVKFAGECTLRLRADIHPRRYKPHETPVRPTHPDFSPSSGALFNAAGSSASYSISGHKSASCNVGPCHFQFTESPTPKSGTINLNNYGSTGKDVFALYNWGPEMKTLKINFLAIGAPETADIFEERITCPDMPATDVPVETVYQGSFVLPNNEVDGVLQLDVAENYNIRNGSFYKTVPRPWSDCGQSGTFEMDVSWDVVIVKFAPDEFTPARRLAGK